MQRAIFTHKTITHPTAFLHYFQNSIKKKNHPQEKRLKLIQETILLHYPLKKAWSCPLIMFISDGDAIKFTNCPLHLHFAAPYSAKSTKQKKEDLEQKCKKQQKKYHSQIGCINLADCFSNACIIRIRVSKTQESKNKKKKRFGSLFLIDGDASFMVNMCLWHMQCKIRQVMKFNTTSATAVKC